ncbi:MAG: type II secretion system protein GspM [Gemmatimonadaceae bacterium]
MKWTTMSARDRRAIVLGVVVLLPGLLLIWGVRPYRAALADARDRLATERETLARERAAVATAQRNPLLQHIADSAMRTMTPRLFEGKDDVMASSELAAYVGDEARRARVWLQDANTRPATPAANGVRTLRVEIRAESDLHGVMQFLQLLENGGKLVRIDRLDISRLAGADDAGAETLTIAATISGFAVGDATPAALAKPVVRSPAPASGEPR